MVIFATRSPRFAEVVATGASVAAGAAASGAVLVGESPDSAAGSAVGAVAEEPEEDHAGPKYDD